MTQQMQLMYTETPCFGENKWTQKITQNTRKYILWRATEVTIAKYPRFARFFLAGVTKKNDAHLQSFVARNAGRGPSRGELIANGLGGSAFCPKFSLVQTGQRTFSHLELPRLRVGVVTEYIYYRPPERSGSWSWFVCLFISFRKPPHR